MCGLVANWCEKGNDSFQKSFCEFALNHMNSRGPDGSECISESWVSLLICFNRLRLRGNKTEGLQPAYSPSKRFVGVFNGELYNIKELNEKLDNSDVVLEDQSEVGVILALFETDIVNGFIALRGMFALIIFDLQDKILYLGRDSFGMKPLYYSNSNESGLSISSSAKALGNYFDLKVSEEARELFSGFGFIPEPFCWFEGLNQVPAGHLISFSKPNTKPKIIVTDTVWDWLEEGVKPEGDLQKIISDSVFRHLDSEFPPVLFQSGGKDSNFIAFCAQQIRKPFALGLTLSFSNPEKIFVADESERAKLVANSLGLVNETVPVSPDMFRNSWLSVIESMDQPSHDGLNIYFISEACKAKNFRLAISGIGADELFSTYGTMGRMFKMKILGLFTSLSYTSFIFNFLKKFYPKLNDSSLFSSFVGRYLVSRSLNSLTATGQSSESNSVDQLLKYYEGKLQNLNVSHRLALIALETDFYMKNQLLRDADWASMANSVEVRMPFVDKEVFKYVINNQDCTITKSKDFMVKVFRQDIRKILNAPKLGFSVPFGFWLDTNLGGQKAVQKRVEADF